MLAEFGLKSGEQRTRESVARENGFDSSPVDRREGTKGCTWKERLTPSSIACSAKPAEPNRGSTHQPTTKTTLATVTTRHTWFVSWALARGKALGLGVAIFVFADLCDCVLWMYKCIWPHWWDPGPFDRDECLRYKVGR